MLENCGFAFSSELVALTKKDRMSVGYLFMAHVCTHAHTHRDSHVMSCDLTDTIPRNLTGREVSYQ